MWDTFQAAATGDVQALTRLLKGDPDLYRAEYWYTQPIRFAVREGHVDAVRILLDAGADLRSVLFAAGGMLDTYDLMWLNEDDEVVRRVSEDPRTANSGCGGVLAAACKQGKRDHLARRRGQDFRA